MSRAPFRSSVGSSLVVTAVLAVPGGSQILVSPASGEAEPWRETHRCAGGPLGQGAPRPIDYDDDGALDVTFGTYSGSDALRCEPGAPRAGSAARPGRERASVERPSVAREVRRVDAPGRDRGQRDSSSAGDGGSRPSHDDRDAAPPAPAAPGGSRATAASPPPPTRSGAAGVPAGPAPPGGAWRAPGELPLPAGTGDVPVPGPIESVLELTVDGLRLPAGSAVGSSAHLALCGMRPASVWIVAVAPDPAEAGRVRVADLIPLRTGCADADGCAVLGLQIPPPRDTEASVWLQAFASDVVHPDEPWVASRGLELVLDPGPGAPSRRAGPLVQNENHSTHHRRTEP